MIWISIVLIASPVCASRFALFALDAQAPKQKGKSAGEIREIAIEKGIIQAVEEATYRLLPEKGFGVTYQKLKSEVFDHANRFVPQYKILGEKTLNGTLEVSLQVTVDLVFLRKTLVSGGFIKTEFERGEASRSLSTLEITNLTNGKVLVEILKFFHQRSDLAGKFRLTRARHGDFIFRFFPLESMDTIATQLLYHAKISKGTFRVVKQKKNQLILSYQPNQSS